MRSSAALVSVNLSCEIDLRKTVRWQKEKRVPRRLPGSSGSCIENHQKNTKDGNEIKWRIFQQNLGAKG